MSKEIANNAHTCKFDKKKKLGSYIKMQLNGKPVYAVKQLIQQIKKIWRSLANKYAENIVKSIDYAFNDITFIDYTFNDINFVDHIKMSTYNQ